MSLNTRKNIHIIPWVNPLPRSSHHQDYMFSRGLRHKSSFATIVGERGQLKPYPCEATLEACQRVMVPSNPWMMCSWQVERFWRKLIGHVWTSFTIKNAQGHTTNNLIICLFVGEYACKPSHKMHPFFEESHCIFCLKKLRLVLRLRCQALCRDTWIFLTGRIG